MRVATGVGVGLAVDAHLTDAFSPGLGFVSYTWNVGWDDRRCNGSWLESNVINTPRLVWELFTEEYHETPEDRLHMTSFMVRFAFASVLLPNERWTRCGDRLEVQRYSLFNFLGLADELRASTFTDFLRREGERARRRVKTPWQRAMVEAGATVGVLHLRLGFNPLEALDFVAGLFTLDLADDDRVLLPGGDDTAGGSAGLPAAARDG